MAFDTRITNAVYKQTFANFVEYCMKLKYILSARQFSLEIVDLYKIVKLKDRA